jgi:hypothetical protein
MKIVVEDLSDKGREWGGDDHCLFF